MTKSLIIAGLSAAALAQAIPAAAEEVTIWAWDPNFNIAILDAAAERYREEHPDVTFNLVELSKPDVEQKLRISLASGAEDTLPDIVLIDDYRAQTFLTAFPGAFAPLTDAIDHDLFAPYKIAVMTVGHDIYGVPFDSGVAVTFYRRDYLEATGFTIDDVQDITWDRFIEIGQQVEAATGHKMLAMDPNDPSFTTILLQSGGRWFIDEAGAVDVVGNPALSQTLEVQRDLIASDVAAQASGWADWVGAFTSGDVASVTAGAWIVGSIKSAEDQAGLWAAAPLPRLEMEGAAHSSNLGGSSFYVLASSEERNAAIDFLRVSFQEDTGFYQQILTNQGAVGTLTAAQQGDAWQQTDDFFGGQQVWSVIGEQLSNVPGVNYGANTAEALAAVQSVLAPVVLGQLAIEPALEAISAQFQSQIQ